MADHPTSTAKNVVSFKTGRPLPPGAGATEPRDLENYAHSDEPDDFTHRMKVNVMAFGFVTLMVVTALWLATSIATMRKDQDCVLSGKRGCSPMEAPAKSQ